VDWCLSVEDLFVVGISCDIAGAYLVSRGLISSPVQIARRTVALWGGNRRTAIEQAEDRVRGQFGLGALVFGFGLQAVAYLLTIAGSNEGSHDTSRVVVAAALAILPGMLVLGVERAFRQHLLRRNLIGLARWNADERREEALPSAKILAGFADELGHPRRSDEPDATYALRVFEIEGVGGDWG
jgi:hypothetical protein